MSIYPPTGTLEIKNATLKIPVVDLQYTSNTAKLEANSNVVTEFSRSKKLIKYPRVALTSAAATSPGYEEYIATASSSYNNASNYDAWAAFNGNVEEGTQEGWLSISGSYDNATPSLPVTSGSNAELFNSRYGDWLNIKLPNKIVLSKLHTYPRTGNENPGVVRDYEHPDAGYLYGSNDGFSTFQEIYSFDGVPVSTTFRVPTIHTVNATKAYNEYRFQVTKLKGQRSFTAISEMELFGTPEYDPEAHGTDVTVKSYPNVPNTDWLEVYYDGQDYAADTDFDQANEVLDKSGNNLHGSQTGGVGFDTVYKAFTFDGTSQYISTTATGISSSAYTLVTWAKILRRSDGTYLLDSIIALGDWASGNGRAIQIGYNTDGSISANLKGFASAITVSNTLSDDKWFHIAGKFTSGGDVNLYIDGVLVDTKPGGDFDIPSNPPLFLGSRANSSGAVETSRLMKGSIANARLFNRPLSSDEIYQLYAYQKEYFGHGDLSMTLKAGRLGIGTSEPRATLDVRGDVHISGSLRKTRALMFRRNSGSYTYTTQNTFQTVVDYGPPWVAYSTNPLYNISHTGDYTDTNNHHMYLRIAIKNESTGEVVYFPDSTGWRYYLHTTHQRLDEHSYQGIFSGLTIGNSYTTSYQIKPAGVSSYTWNSTYGDITGIVWD